MACMLLDWFSIHVRLSLQIHGILRVGDFSPTTGGAFLHAAMYALPGLEQVSCL